MPIPLSELLGSTSRIEIPFQGMVVEVEFWPNRLTLEFLSGNPDALEQIVHLVKWWNITDEAGEVNVAETVKKLPVQLLTMILEKIVESLSLKQEKNG